MAGRDVLFEFHLKSRNTASIGFFQLEVYYNVDRLLTSQTAEQKGITASQVSL